MQDNAPLPDNEHLVVPRSGEKNSADNSVTVKQARMMLENSLRHARLCDSVRLKREWNRLDLRE
ncbi:MAG: hypothetical protein J6Q81_06030, partial [Lentisphaeria bacterium]|nr:hypothetical protein [Lentisphaeria bacterium]